MANAKEDLSNQQMKDPKIAAYNITEASPIPLAKLLNDSTKVAARCIPTNKPDAVILAHVILDLKEEWDNYSKAPNREDDVTGMRLFKPNLVVTALTAEAIEVSKSQGLQATSKMMVVKTDAALVTDPGTQLIEWCTKKVKVSVDEEMLANPIF